MFKWYLIIALVMQNAWANAQTQVDSISVKKVFKLNGKKVTGISNDTALAVKDSNALITDYAAKKLIKPESDPVWLADKPNYPTTSSIQATYPPFSGAGAYGTWNINILGNAPTLTTSRYIYGNLFNGSADVTGTIGDTYIASAANWNGKQAAYTNLTSIGSLANGAGVLYNNGTGTFTYTTTPTLTGTNFSGIPNVALTNSSININGNIVSLGGSTTVTATATNALIIGTDLSGTSYNGSAAVTINNTSTLNSVVGRGSIITGTNLLRFYNASGNNGIQYYNSSNNNGYGLGFSNTSDSSFTLNYDVALGVTKQNIFKFLKDGTGTFYGSITASSLIKSGGTASQFLKADGSVDANAYLTSTTGVTSIIGTANQVIASASTGAVTLSLPQSIATTSTPTFVGQTLTGPLNGTTASFSGDLSTQTQYNAGSTGYISQLLGGSANNAVNINVSSNTTKWGVGSNQGFQSVINNRNLNFNYFDSTSWHNYMYITPAGDATFNGNVNVNSNTFNLFNASTNSSIFSNYNNSNIVRLVAASNGNGYVGVSAGPGSLSIGVTSNPNSLVFNNTGAATFNSSVTGASFIKSGGTSSQLLSADGGVVTAGSNISISGGTISANNGYSTLVGYYLPSRVDSSNCSLVSIDSISYNININGSVGTFTVGGWIKLAPIAVGSIFYSISVPSIISSYYLNHGGGSGSTSTSEPSAAIYRNSTYNSINILSYANNTSVHAYYFTATYSFSSNSF